jgi:hypothetical protein
MLMSNNPNRHALQPSDSTKPRSRIQGGNWNAHGLRRANELYDEVECKFSVEQFILEQGLPRDGDFN